jgi:hypothetical protein
MDAAAWLKASFGTSANARINVIQKSMDENGL